MLGRHDAIEEIHVQEGDRELRATLGVPHGPVGLVVLAGLRGLGGLAQPREDIALANRLVAEALRARGLATLELAIPPGEDLEDLARDMLALTDHVVAHTTVSHLPIGFLGADCYAAAAVMAAARKPDLVRAIVAFGGRIDVAGPALASVSAPTLLVCGSEDDELIERDRQAIDEMTTISQLALIPGAFSDPRMLDEVVQLAAEWFIDALARVLQEPASRRGSWGRQFRDRRCAGERLAVALAHHAGAGTVVFGVTRGGVVVADEIARRLHAPLDVWLVRKIGMPIQPELGMGALAEGAALVLDPAIVRWSGASHEEIQAIVHRKVAEIRRRAALYRDNLPAPDVRGKTVILVDDGIATGGTLRAAVRGARKRGASRVVVTAPVAASQAIATLEREVDEFVSLATPKHMISVGSWYQDFRPVREDEVVAVLAEARARSSAAA